MRFFVLTNIEQEDYEILMSRVVRPGNIVESLRNSSWNTATMLVFRNEVRTHINNLSVFNFALQTHQPPIVIVAMDQIHSRTIDHAELQRFLLSLSDNKTEGLPGFLPVVQNMSVMITHNIATELHTVKPLYSEHQRDCPKTVH